ncbi:hypothetical protein [Fusobacterium sp.]|uniref:hypothetical protein n=1 Tax=Fusobacterium sp. TaxID=68766 RepID=UPI0029042EA2|nr:hypothetical protein [Fusobacterium sp.]MDU1911587.1 hypothetical protein [Fusobacterium sp.]
MRASIKIGEKIKKKHNFQSENGEIQTVVDDGDLIQLSEKEIINIQLNSIKIGKDLKNNEFDKSIINIGKELAQSGGYATPTSLVKEEMGFSITVKGRIIAAADEMTLLGIFTNTGNVTGLIPSSSSDYKSYEESLKAKWKFKDVFQGIEMMGAIKKDTQNWKKLDLGKSAENCNKLKKWALTYKKSENFTPPTYNGVEEEFKDYKDVKIEIVLSEIQSLVYEIPSMYIDSYSESFDIEKGEGTYVFTLKEKYNRGINDVTMEVNKEKFGDKITGGIGNIMKKFSELEKKKEN